MKVRLKRWTMEVEEVYHNSYLKSWAFFGVLNKLIIY